MNSVEDFSRVEESSSPAALPEGIRLTPAALFVRPHEIWLSLPKIRSRCKSVSRISIGNEFLGLRKHLSNRAS
jgi:hypothetical protein